MVVQYENSFLSQELHKDEAMSRHQPQESSRRSTGGAEGSSNEVRILIIGKSGNGKSTLGNTILGDSSFKTGKGMTETTQRTQEAAANRFDRHIKVIDTADICNLDKDPKDMKKDVNFWKAAQPTVVLLTVRCDCRYTPEEFGIYKRISQLWKYRSLKKRLVVAFTFHDRQDHDLRKQLKTVSGELRKVLKDASDRYVEFNNDEGTPQTTKEEQVKRLMGVIQGMEEANKKKTKQKKSRLLSWCTRGTQPLNYHVRSMSCGDVSELNELILLL